MAKRPHQVYSEAQMVLDIARETGIPVVQIRKIFKAWFKAAGNEFLNNKVVPLPGGAGYIYPTLTTSKPRKQHSPLIGADVEIQPKLKTMAKFSDPWKELIHNDLRAKNLIESLIKDFNK